jgi:hypothetical protein
MRGVALSCVLLLISCGDNAESAQQNESDWVTVNGPVAKAEPTRREPTKQEPNYSEREGDTYFYISAISEEDQKKGKAVGDVLGYQYLGIKDGMHTLQLVGGDGTPLGTYECATECKIIKRRGRSGVERIPYEPGSVIGSAFADAIAGNLMVAKGVLKARAAADQVAFVPAAFRGEWNEDPQKCGVAASEGYLLVQARALHFYESDGTVTNVESTGPGAIKITATLEGEGERWSDSFNLKLSEENGRLSMGEVVRQRCSTKNP